MHSTRRAALVGVACLAVLGACAVERLAGPREAGAVSCGHGVVRVAVGQAVIPAKGVKRCELAPAAGAEYALAWVDTRAITASQTGIEPILDQYPIRMNLTAAATARGDGSGDASSNDAGATDAPTPDADHTPLHGPAIELSSSEVESARPRHRTTPLTLGELFLLDDGLGPLPRPARVVRVYQDTTVVVRWEEDPTDGLNEFLAQLDTAYATYRAQALPIHRHAYVDAMPRSTGAGQTLIILQQDVLVQGRTFAEVSGDTLFSWLELLPFPYFNSHRLAQFLAHETTHLYQRMYLHASRPEPGIASTLGAAWWATEGAANLVSYEMLRRIVGIAPNANYDWRAPTTTLPAAHFAQRAQPAGGVITAGFDHAMGFFRDLTLRRMGAGESVEPALRAVLRGASEGWYGRDGVTQRTGLVARMQQAVGAQWNPADALLTWALSHVGDDLTSNPIYQDRASLRVWQLPAGQSYGWRPDAVLSADAPYVLFFKSYGSPGFVLIQDTGAGLDLTVEGFNVPVAWKALRIR
ncbi:MAG: hypothetical protein WD771_02240 [Gemmatimonadaceae bacterium]